MIVSKHRSICIITNRRMAFGRSNVSRNRNSWGPMSVPTGFHRPEPDEEFAEEYTERMMSAQMRQLDPLKEDLADWINKTLGFSIWKSTSLIRLRSQRLVGFESVPECISSSDCLACVLRADNT
ncbi:hypothetical protein MTP99_012674 [Tenebrio molitor]|nr:hypothetical protein MTP99_012674 [Tenebrio molitor]